MSVSETSNAKPSNGLAPSQPVKARGTLLGRACYCVAVPAKIAATLSNRPAISAISGLGYATTAILSKIFWGIHKVAIYASDQELIDASLTVTSEISTRQIQSAGNTAGKIQNLASIFPVVSTVMAGAKSINDTNLKVTDGVVQYTYSTLSAILPSIFKTIGQVSARVGAGFEAISSHLKYTTFNPGYVDEMLQNLADRSASVAFKLLYMGQGWVDIERKEVKEVDLSKIEVSQDDLVEFISLPYEEKQDRVDIVASSKSLNVSWPSYKQYLDLIAKTKSKSNANNKVISDLQTEIKKLQIALNEGSETDSDKKRDLEKEIEVKKERVFSYAQEIVDSLKTSEREEFIKLIKLYKARGDSDLSLTYNDCIQTFDFEKKLRLLKLVRNYSKGILLKERKSLEKVKFISNEKEWLLNFPDEKIRENLLRFAIIRFNQLPEETKSKFHDITLAQLEQIQLKDRVDLFNLTKETLEHVISEKKNKISEHENLLNSSNNGIFLWAGDELDDETAHRLQREIEFLQSEINHLEEGINKLTNLQYEEVEDEDPFKGIELKLEERKDFLQEKSCLRAFRDIINNYVPNQAKYLIQESMEGALSIFVFEKEEDIECEIENVKEKIEKSSHVSEKEQLKSYLDGLEKAYDSQKEIHIEALYDEKENSLILTKDGLPLYKAPLPALSIEDIQQKIGSGVVSQGIWLRAGEAVGAAGGSMIQGSGYLPWATFTIFGRMSNPTAIRYAFNTAASAFPLVSSYVTPAFAQFLERAGVPVRTIEDLSIEMTKSVAKLGTWTLQTTADTVDQVLGNINAIADQDQLTKTLEIAKNDVNTAKEGAVSALVNYCSKQTGAHGICNELQNYSIKGLTEQMLNAFNQSKNKKDLTAVISLMAPKSTELTLLETFKGVFSTLPRISELNEITADSSVADGMSKLADQLARVAYLQEDLSKTMDTLRVMDTYSSILEPILKSLGEENLSTLRNVTSVLHDGVTWAKHKIGIVNQAQQLSALSLDLAYLPGKVQDAAAGVGQKGVDAIQAAEQYIGGESTLSAGTKLFMSYGLPFLSATFLTGGGYVVLPYFLNNVVPKLTKASGVMLSNNLRPFWYGLAEGSFTMADKAGKKVKDLGVKAGTSIQAWMNKGRYIDPSRIKNFMALPLEAQNHVIELILRSEHVQRENASSERDLKIDLQDAAEKFNNKMLSNEELEAFVRKILFYFDHLQTYELIRMSETYYHLMNRNIQLRIRNIVKKECKVKKKDLSNAERIISLFNELPLEKRKKIDIMPVYEFHALDVEAQRDVKFMIIHSKEYQELLKQEGRKIPLSYVELCSELKASRSWNNSRLKQVLSIYSQLEERENQRYVLTPMRLQKMPAGRIMHAIDLVEKYGYEKVGAHFDIKKMDRLRSVLHDEMEGKTLTIPQKKLKAENIELLAAAFRMLGNHQQREFLNLSEKELLTMENHQLRELAIYLASSVSEKDPELLDILVKLKEDRDSLPENLRHNLLSKFNALPFERQAEYQSYLNAGLNQKETLIQTFTNEVNELDIAIKVAIKEQKKAIKAIKGLKDGIEVAKSKKASLLRDNEEPLSHEVEKKVKELDEKIKQFTASYEEKTKVADYYEKVISEKSKPREYFAKLLEEEGVTVASHPLSDKLWQISEAEERAIELIQELLIKNTFDTSKQQIEKKLTLVELDNTYKYAKEFFNIFIENTEKNLRDLQEKRTALLEHRSDPDKKYELMYIEDRLIPIHEMILEKMGGVFISLEKVYEEQKRKIEPTTLLQEEMAKKEGEFTLACQNYNKLGQDFNETEELLQCYRHAKEFFGDGENIAHGRINALIKKKQSLLSEMEMLKKRILELKSGIYEDQKALQEKKVEAPIPDHIEKQTIESPILATEEKIAPIPVNKNSLLYMVLVFASSIDVNQNMDSVNASYASQTNLIEEKLSAIRRKYFELLGHAQNGADDVHKLKSILEESELWTQFKRAVDKLTEDKIKSLQFQGFDQPQDVSSTSIGGSVDLISRVHDIVDEPLAKRPKGEPKEEIRNVLRSHPKEPQLLESESPHIRKEEPPKPMPENQPKAQQPSPIRPQSSRKRGFSSNVQAFFAGIGRSFKRFGGWFMGLFRRNKPKA